MHTINAKSEFPACAAFDVDHDGDVDIYSGGWWYEAPEWKKHKVRDVEIIRGRYDDYSNQPMDCNGDGWTDIISVNYRSETIYWIEHPGKKLGQQDWTAHVIDKPGPSETGRLHDIDGDGDLDILPNGTTYAAWYEFKPEKKEAGTLTPKWEKHDLPQELAGHGLGMAWLYQRPYILANKGFLMAHRSSDNDGHGERAARWSFHPYERHDDEKNDDKATILTYLPPDASVPILHSKTTNRLFVGRGHRTGVYAGRFGPSEGSLPWLEISTIDSSWSQCHAPLLADVDNDGEEDVIAGKRYLGHEGKDPGEYDPLVIYWYKYANAGETTTKSWHRHVIQEGGPSGIDLDAKAVDVDADGDLDLIAPSRNGLYLHENLLINKQGAEPDKIRDDHYQSYPNHAQLLTYATDDGDLRPVKTPFDWGRRRWHILKGMEAVMGPLPNPSQRFGGASNPEPLPEQDPARSYHAYRATINPGRGLLQIHVALLVPKAEGRHPAMLCLHPTSIEHGRKIVTGEVEAENRNYAHELAERGYVCICPDYPTMGENPFDLKTTHKHYQSGTMKAIWDNIRCLDVLESLPYVDPDRIGVIGHSLGGHNGLFTACFDQRIKCVVTSCGFTPFHDYYGGKLAGWTQDRYMPRIRDVYESDPDKMPFDFYEVLGAIAPRPLFINAPLHDDNFDVKGVKRAVAEAQQVYDLLGKPDALQVRYPDCAHDFPDDVRQEVYEWLDKQLR